MSYQLWQCKCGWSVKFYGQWQNEPILAHCATEHPDPDDPANHYENVYFDPDAAFDSTIPEGARPSMGALSDRETVMVGWMRERKECLFVDPADPDLVERVARALHDAQNQPENLIYAVDRDYDRYLARAALAALAPEVKP